MLLNGAARVRADMDGEHVGDREFRTDPEQQRRDAQRSWRRLIPSGSQCPSAFPRRGAARALRESARAIGEAEVDGIDNRIEDSAEAPLLRVFSGAIERGEIASGAGINTGRAPVSSAIARLRSVRLRR